MTVSSPEAHARRAADAIRDYNRATVMTGGLTVADLYAILAELAALADRLPQALIQTSTALANQRDLTTGAGADPYSVKHDALAELAAAVTNARRTANGINTAWNAVGRLGQHDTEEGAQ